jgi:hypothetical protein
MVNATFSDPDGAGSFEGLRNGLWLADYNQLRSHPEKPP